MKTELITGYIQKKEGGTVAQQFEDTFEGGEGFDEQNPNALKYILNCLKQILSDSPFTDDSDIEQYAENLADYLNRVTA